MSKNTYIGLTIGPIYHTLDRVKSTRALFAGSYLYSYLMRRLMEELAPLQNRILTPGTKLLAAGEKQHQEVGFYADRLVIEAKSGDWEKVLEARKTVSAEIAQNIAAELGSSQQDVSDQLEHFLQLYTFESEFATGPDTIAEVNQVLHSLELQRNFHPELNNYLLRFINRKKQNFLIQDAFKDKGRFDSLIEISTRGLKFVDQNLYRQIIRDHVWKNTKDADTDVADEDVVIKAFKAKKIQGTNAKRLENPFRESFRAYHKYVAIVQADGDNIGKYIEGLQGDLSKIRAFSDKMLDFGKEAKNLITEHGGTPIYIGGDDLLFLAPVACRKNTDQEPTNIFLLIEEIDRAFKKYFNESDGPSISYGLAITYYKYPLNEARQVAYDLLNQQAKDKALYPDKNAIAFSLIKHSGQSIETSFSKSKTRGRAYRRFRRLMRWGMDHPQFLNSLTHVLSFHQTTIDHLMTKRKQGEEIENKEERLTNFLSNNFDEAIHEDNQEFFRTAAEMMVALYKDYQPTEKEGKSSGQKGQVTGPLARLYAALRFIHFLNSKDNE